MQVLNAIVNLFFSKQNSVIIILVHIFELSEICWLESGFKKKKNPSFDVGRFNMFLLKKVFHTLKSKIINIWYISVRLYLMTVIDVYFVIKGN